MNSVALLSKRFASVWAILDERTRRIMAANEALGLGYGGITKVRLACGLSRKAIAKGIHASNTTSVVNPTVAAKTPETHSAMDPTTN